MKGLVLAACAAVGLAVLASGCTGSPGSSVPTSTPKPASKSAGNTAAAPAGYQRIGGVAQGISLDVPSTWVAVDFSQTSVQQAVKLFGLSGSTETAFSQELAPLVKDHAVYAADVKDAATLPGHFVTNVNAYCAASGVSQTGIDGVTALASSWASQLQQLGAQNVTQTGAEMGGVAGEQTSYTLSASSANVTLHATQLEVLPKAGKACFVTLTAAGSTPSAVLTEAISSIQYS